MPEHARESIDGGPTARWPSLLPLLEWNIGEWVEGAGQAGVFLALPCPQAVISHRERPEPVQLIALDLRWRIQAHRDSVHEAVSTQREASHSREPLQPLIDRTAVRTGEPGKLRGTAGSGPKADDAEVILAGHIGAPPLQWMVFAPAGLPQSGAARPRGDRAADLPARNMHTQLVNTLAQCGIGGGDFLFHVLAVPAAPPSDAHHLHASRARSSPGAPCGGCAVAGTTGQVPEQSSARELAQV